jgi:flotillin
MRAESYDAKTTKNVNVTCMTEKEVREAVGAATMAEAIPAK